jgi:AcrR family transcriptional regulator
LQRSLKIAAENAGIANDNSLTIFLQNIDELITFECGRNDTVACDAALLNLLGMKTATKPKWQATGQTNLTLSGNGKGASRKRTRDRAAKKQALIQAALELFASKGFDVTTTREIAASAGCAEGLIHRYFKGKPGLLAALIESRVSKEALNPHHPSRPARNLEDEFLQLVDQEVERIWQSRDFLRVVIPRAIVDPSVGNAVNKAVISVRAKEISDRLNRCRSSATLPEGTTEALTEAVGMLGLVFGFVRPVLLGHDRLQAKHMAATMAKVLVGSAAVSLVA